MTSWRELRPELAAAADDAPKGFFIPYRHAADLPGPGQRPPYPWVEALFRAEAASFQRWLAAVDSFAADLARLGGPPPEPRWQQSWFPGLDAAIAYAMVRTQRPRRIVEIGSGHSTRFLARAVRDGALDCALTTIDPAPRAALAGLPVTAIARLVHDVGMGPFAALAPGDFVVIDSSHILMPGSDADFLFNRVLPALPDGIAVHVHDVFLPDDYPADWAWRGYNEQLGVAQLLQGGAWRPLFASHFVRTRLQAALAASVVARLPMPDEAVESSLWLMRGG